MPELQRIVCKMACMFYVCHYYYHHYYMVVIIITPSSSPSSSSSSSCNWPYVQNTNPYCVLITQAYYVVIVMMMMMMMITGYLTDFQHLHSPSCRFMLRPRSGPWPASEVSLTVKLLEHIAPFGKQNFRPDAFVWLLLLLLLLSPLNSMDHFFHAIGLKNVPYNCL